MNKVVVVIPARYASQRLPGKPLRKIAGTSLIKRVYESAGKIKCADQIIIATDDERIRTEVESFGGKVAMTHPDLPSGSDRIGAAIKNINCDIVINLQGDEPIVDTAAIDQTVKYMLENPDVEFATLGYPMKNEADFLNPNIVKVIVDKKRQALYFSRAAIPFHRGGKFQENNVLFQHIGVYLYRKSALLKFIKWAPASMEKIEKLEQLRILYQGSKIYVHPVKIKSVGVDVEEDIYKIEALLKKEGQF